MTHDVFDPVRLVRVLAEHDVHYVLIGAVAARLAGYPLATYDTDMTPERSRENLTRLAAALRALNARVFTASIPEGLPFDCSAQTLARADVWNLVTSAGRVNLLFKPAGSGGYADLVKAAHRYDVAGITVAAASLESIIKMKEAADRPKDRQAIAILKAMLERE